MMEERLEGAEEKMDGQHGRVNKSLDALFMKLESLPTVYVSRESLKYQLDNFNDRVEPWLTSLRWLLRMIAGGFLYALAQYVYVKNSK